jgi:hypothetical protein
MQKTLRKKNTEESSHHNNDNKPKTAQNLEKETEEIITTKQNQDAQDL